MDTTENNYQDYQKSVIVRTTELNAFKALTSDIDKWWGKTEGEIEKVGNVFKVTWGEPWYQFKIIEFTENNILTWECIDANQIIKGLENVQKEWVGSKLYWKIENMGNETITISLKHIGLLPTDICYETCSNAWDHFIGEELKSFLESN